LRVLFPEDPTRVAFPNVEVNGQINEGHLAVANGHVSSGESIVPTRFFWIDTLTGDYTPIRVDLFALQKGLLPFQTRIILPKQHINHTYTLEPLYLHCRQHELRIRANMLMTQLGIDPRLR
jgi:hypothetical protein